MLCSCVDCYNYQGLPLPVAGEVAYEVHVNGSLLDHVSSVVSGEVGGAFDGVWMIVVHWNNVPSHSDSSQVMIFIAATSGGGCRLYGCLSHVVALITFQSTWLCDGLYNLYICVQLSQSTRKVIHMVCLCCSLAIHDLT